MVSEIAESTGGYSEASCGDMVRQAGDPAADVDDHFGVWVMRFGLQPAD